MTTNRIEQAHKSNLDIFLPRFDLSVILQRQTIDVIPCSISTLCDTQEVEECVQLLASPLSPKLYAHCDLPELFLRVQRIQSACEMKAKSGISHHTCLLHSHISEVMANPHHHTTLVLWHVQILNEHTCIIWKIIRSKFTKCEMIATRYNITIPIKEIMWLPDHIGNKVNHVPHMPYIVCKFGNSCGCIEYLFSFPNPTW